MGLGTKVSHWAPEAKPRWGSGAKPPEADDLTIKCPIIFIILTTITQLRKLFNETGKRATRAQEPGTY